MLLFCSLVKEEMKSSTCTARRIRALLRLRFVETRLQRLRLMLRLQNWKLAWNRYTRESLGAVCFNN